MQEIRKPSKKPLIFYYLVAMLILLVLNAALFPAIMKQPVQGVTCDAFMSMTKEQRIGEVEIRDDKILFTDKDRNIYQTTATDLARSMVSRFGMGEEFGFVAFETMSNQYLGGDTSLDCSPETQARVDQKITRLVEEQYPKAMGILKENEDKLHQLSQYLYDHETITGREFVDILEGRAG